MNPEKFGSKLRELRNKHIPPITQEALALKVGKTKMLISSFESGKNAPPEEPLLSEIITALNLTREQSNELSFLASYERSKIPGDIADYCYANPSIFAVIRAAKNMGLNEIYWKDLLRTIEEDSHVQNP